MLCWGANQLGNICCPSGKVTGVTVPGLGVHSIPPSSPPAAKPSPPLEAHRPCRHNHRTATLGSQKLALIYMEPWDGLRLSVHQSVSRSCLDRTLPALDLGYRLRQSETQICDWSSEASGEPPLLFDQLIDLLTLAAGRLINGVDAPVGGASSSVESPAPLGFTLLHHQKYP
ncbi:unnamed protein product [Pleuronectes platessa]|uniref:Uncharacterized protein n=1 Tax=Pleuronectes platessa TaxID=8262 RepID=A0A9N7TW54_PLEPL|nr:unnamed protein product [Pleuronectes platessa]